MNIRINLVNTSNKGKQREFTRLFEQYGYSHGQLEFKGIDLPEIDAEPEMVAAMKAVMAAQHYQMGSVLIDDTSLDIEGAPGAGVKIRDWLDNDPERFKQFIGRPATFRCILAYTIQYQHDQNTVCYVKAEVKGKISERKESADYISFGFDPVFVPDGTTESLAQAKPDKYNARALAVQKLMNREVENIICPLPHLWTGQWQKLDQKPTLFQPAPKSDENQQVLPGAKI